MEKKVSILLVGIGGYGNLYVNELLDHGDEHNVEIAGIVDPFPQGCKRFNDLQQADIPMYRLMEEFYQINKADLAIVSSPIHIIVSKFVLHYLMEVMYYVKNRLVQH